MDFHALPRRDLQALCKRNGVRANMTNAAMADALGALPTVDGVEEYVKQPAAVPEPVGKAAVVEEVVRREKQGSPLPRGRRVTVKASEVVKLDEGNGKEDEKANAKLESNKEEDAPALGVGRRGASRRARHAPVAEEKQGSRRSRRATVKSIETDRPDDGVQKEDLNQEANKEEPTVQGAVRRGPGRRAQAAPVAAASKAEPETKAVVVAEEMPPEPVKPADSVEEVEDVKRETNNDDAPAQGVGRRGPSRRARPVPVVPKPTAKASVQEELRSPPPLGRRATVTVKSSAPTVVDGGEEDEKEDMLRDAVKEIVPGLGIGRRGARGRAHPELTVPAPAEDAPIPRGRRGKAKVLEPIRLNGGEEEDTKELKLEEKEEVAPAHGVVHRDPSRRTRPTHVEAPVKRRSDPTNTIEEQDVPVDAVLVRPTRTRKPTMKAAAAAEENVPRRTTKKATTRHSTLQKEKQQEEPQETVPAMVSDEGCYDPENMEETAPPQDVEQSQVTDEPKQEDKEISEAPMYEGEIPMEEPRADEPLVTDEVVVIDKSLKEEPPVIDLECPGNLAVETPHCKDKSLVEVVPAMVSDEGCYDPENVEETAPPLDVEQSQVTDEPKQEGKEISEALMYEDEIPMEEPPADEPPVTDEVVLIDQSLKEKPPVIDQENVEETDLPQNVEQSEMTDEPEQDYKGGLMNEDEIPMEEPPADEPPMTDEVVMIDQSLEEEPPVIDLECLGNLLVEKPHCKDKSLVEEQQIDAKLCATLPSLEDSPVLGLVSMFAEQTVEKDVDRGVHFKEGGGTSEEQHKGVHEAHHHADEEIEMNVGEEMEIVPFSQLLQAPLIADDLAVEAIFTATVGTAHFQESAGPSEEQLDKGVHQAHHHADGEIKMNVGEEMEILPFSQLLQAPLITDEPALEANFTCHANHGREMESSNSVLHRTVITTVDAEDGLLCQEKGDVAHDEMEEQPKTVDETVILHCSGNISSVLEEKAVETSVVEEKAVETMVHANEQKAVFCMEKDERVTESLIQTISSMDEDVAKDSFQTDFDGDKADGATDKLPRSISKMNEDVEEGNFQSDFVTQSGWTLPRTRRKRELCASGCLFNEQNLVVNVEKVELVTDKLPQSIATMYEYGEEDSQTDFVHVNEQKEITPAQRMEEVAKEMQQSAATMDGEDFSEDQLEADFIIDEKHKEGAATDKDPKLTKTGSEVHEQEQEKAIEVTKEMQQSTDTMDVEDVSEDQLETYFILAEKHKEGADTGKDPKLKGTDGEVCEQEKAIEITEEMPQSIGSMNECVQEGCFGIYFAHADELKKVVSGDKLLEVTETEDEVIQKDSVLAGDIAGDYSDHITSALLDDITESLSILTITEPMVPRDEDVPLCKNSSQKNTDEAECKNKSEKNTAEPVAMQENMGVKVTKKSDLNDLTLGKLRAKLRKTLEHKKEKRVALARVDENVCRSNGTEQEQVRKVQQY